MKKLLFLVILLLQFYNQLNAQSWHTATDIRWIDNKTKFVFSEYYGCGQTLLRKDTFTLSSSSNFTLTTTGTGIATLTNGILNIPNNSAGGDVLLNGNTMPMNQDFIIGSKTINGLVVMKQNEVPFLYATPSSTGTSNLDFSTDRGTSFYSRNTINNYGWPSLSIQNEEVSGRKSTNFLTWSTISDSRAFGNFGGLNTNNTNESVFVYGEDGRLGYKPLGKSSVYVYKDSASLDITRTRFRVRNLDPTGFPMLQTTTSLSTKRLELYSNSNDNENNVTVTINLPPSKVDVEYTVHVTTSGGTLGGIIFNPASNQTIISNATWFPGINQPEGVIRLYYFADSTTSGRWQIVN